MQAVAQKIQSSNDYIKCGEILKCQNSIQDPYVLRCIQCKDIYLLLESFIFHLDDTCKHATESKKENVSEVIDCSLNENEVMNEPLYEGIPVKLENIYEEKEGPLSDAENESDAEQSIIKIEPTGFSEINDFELESSTQFEITEYVDEEEEEEFFDSQDECESRESMPEDDETIPYSFVCNFIQSKINVTILIKVFKDQPQLWNKTMLHYGNKLKRREYMIEIAKYLKSNHKININGSQVSAVIEHLYREYQDDLNSAQEKGHGGDDKSQIYVKPWYFAELDFIKPYLGNYSLEVLTPNHPNLSYDQIVQILNIYKCLPHLWNSNLIESHCKSKRHESIFEMIKQIETTINLQINENELEQYLLTVHNYFSREKRRILDDKISSETVDGEQSNNKYYDSLMFLYDHVTPLRCSVCGGESSSPLHFKIHTSSHDGAMPFTCSKCNKTFKQINVYLTHAKRHFLHLNYMCKECDKKFASDSHLRLHMRIHTDDKPYSCETCGESFRFLHSLSTHRRRHDIYYPYTCEKCSRGFYTQLQLDDHMNSHMNIRPYKCDICNKTFVTTQAMKIHKAVHEDARKYACKLCDKSFKHKSNLFHHQKTHINKRSHICNICNKTFSTKQFLEAHRDEEHKGERSYACKLCDKTFKYRTSVYHHMKTHESGKTKLLTYKNIDEDGRKFGCTLCDKTFKCRTSVYPHMRTHDRVKTKDLVETKVKSEV